MTTIPTKKSNIIAYFENLIVGNVIYFLNMYVKLFVPIRCYILFNS